VSFTIDDFQDLLRLLDQHPEWRAELRRHVLSDELLELPALVRQLAEAQARTESALGTLTTRVDALAEAQVRTESALGTLTSRVDTLAAQLEAITARMEARLKRVEDDVGDLKGKMAEMLYARRAPAYFSRLARRLRVLEPGQLADQLDDAVLARQLTEDERDAILQADVVLTGVRREDQTEMYFVVEVSAGIGPSDVERAVERARLLAKAGCPVVAVVAGDRIDPDPGALARAAGVWQVVDGHAIPPEQPDSA
jgi:chromosome segregation ATPase